LSIGSASGLTSGIGWRAADGGLRYLAVVFGHAECTPRPASCAM